MSGITPILDTLLHQVLGKRVEIPVAKDLPAPVAAKTSSDAIQPARSDSRLHPQGGGTVGSPSREVTADARPTQETLATQRTAPASTQLHLSRTATVIADLLDRFPADRLATIRPLAPLLSRHVGDAQIVAGTLSRGVSQSGLFYESHLLRWMEGEMPRGALIREPQAWLGLRFLATTPNQTPLPLQIWPQAFRVPGGTIGARDAAAPAARQETLGHRDGQAESARSGPGGTEGRFGSGPTVTANPQARAPMATMMHMESSEASLADDQLSVSMVDRHQVGRHSSDALQSLVRHQLELVVAPEVRWEGQLWPNVAMTMLLAPAYEGEEGRSDTESSSSTEEARGWEATIDVAFPRLGLVTLHLQSSSGGRLSARIEPALAESRLQMAAALGELRARLDKLDASVELSAGPGHE
ncbi:hypothetical protein [Salinicola rhizosphaerae]|uniref:Flagellar hook-length control protein FliK n=1 Tax=Salinicola rhizosphaerae TaxID=1443141 RepID=A0ABQ3DP93_9GAMM|nr:hypothetical protein [Salinicola rhizosphaerae]GHB10279.1 flagellar hook-length control protein FliK [Salinicola rhizosphaerae]